MITLVNLDHIVLNTYDKVDDMLDFYCQTLGCQVEREVKTFDLIQLRAGFAIIDLQNTKQARQGTDKINEQSNLLHFCLTITEPIDDGLIARLKETGITVSDINTNYGAQGFGSSIYITDPCGNIVELKQHYPSLP